MRNLVRKGRRIPRGIGRRGGRRPGRAAAAAMAGYCICPNCGRRYVHRRGVPCFQQKCLNCGVPMVRDFGGKIPATTLGWGEATGKKAEKQIPTIDVEKCIGCGICADRCPRNAIVITEGKAVVDSQLCSGCFACVPVCPKNAISVTL